MKYTVEFEMESDEDEAIRERVQHVLVHAFGSIDKLAIVPCKTYIANIKGSEPVIWTEVS
jgi:hypothetical protein